MKNISKQKYGSEWNLSQYLSSKEWIFKKAIIDEIGINGVVSIEWLIPDKYKEFRGIDFIENPDQRIVDDWKAFWPQRGNPHNWDAIGKMYLNNHKNYFEYILVEAKAHAGEVKTSCRAKSLKSIKMISNALDKTRRYIGVSDNCDYLNGYYQAANRLAFLYFLREHNINARLVLLYFLGDKHLGKDCPMNKGAWFSSCLNDERNHLGLKDNHPLVDRIHKVFLPAYTNH